MKGILGRKIGMTEKFTTNGKVIPVTVIEVEPNVITQIKTVENDGYNAIQLGVVDKKESRATKSEIGHAKKAGVAPKRFLKEIRVEDVKALTKYGVQAGSIIESQETLRGIFRESAGIEMTSDFRARQEYITAPIIQRRLTEKKDDFLKANINNVTIQQMTEKNKAKVYDRMGLETEYIEILLRSIKKFKAGYL